MRARHNARSPTSLLEPSQTSFLEEDQGQGQLASRPACSLHDARLPHPPATASPVVPKARNYMVPKARNYMVPKARNYMVPKARNQYWERRKF